MRIALLGVLLAVQDDPVQAKARKTSEGYELSVSAVEGTYPVGSIARFGWSRESFGTSTADLVLKPRKEEFEVTHAQVRRGAGSWPVRVVRPGLYHVDASFNQEDQVDPKIHGSFAQLKGFAGSRAIVAGSCAEWSQAVTQAHARLRQLIDETDRVASGEVTERTRANAEKLYSKVEQERDLLVLSATPEALLEAIKQIVSELGYPVGKVTDARPAPSKEIGEAGRPDARVERRDAPDQPYAAPKDKPEGGDAPRTGNGPPVGGKATDQAQVNQRISSGIRQLLDRIRGLLAREAAATLLTRGVSGGTADELKKLAEAERALAESDTRFTCDSIRTGVARIQKDAAVQPSVAAGWQTKIQELCK